MTKSFYRSSVAVAVLACVFPALMSGLGHAQELSGAAKFPAVGTRNSIYHYNVTWTYGGDGSANGVYPWAGNTVTLRAPEEVKVDTELITIVLPRPLAPPYNRVDLNRFDVVSIVGVYDNANFSPPNYYGGLGSSLTSKGVINLSQNLPPAGYTNVYVRANVSRLRFRLPDLLGTDNQYEVRTAAGIEYKPLLKPDADLNPSSLICNAGAVTYEPLENQPIARLINQASAPDADGWRTLYIPNPPVDCINELTADPVSVEATAGSDFVDFTIDGEAPEDRFSVHSIVGVFDNPNLTGTNYYTGGSWDAQRHIIQLGQALPDPLPNNPEVWVVYREVRPFAFDPDEADQVVTIRCGGYRVVEDNYPIGFFRDRGTTGNGGTGQIDRTIIYARANPIVGVTGVFTKDGTNIYTAGSSFNSLTGQIKLASEPPATVNTVKVVYWVGPLRMDGAGGDFVDADGVSVPFCAAPGPNAQPPKNGTKFVVSGSPGLNLANDPWGVPGIRYMTNPGVDEAPFPEFTWQTKYIPRSSGQLDRVNETDDPNFAYLKASEKSVKIVSSVVHGSDYGLPSRLDRVTATNVYSIQVAPPKGGIVQRVIGVWSNPFTLLYGEWPWMSSALKGINYYTGPSASVDIANVITLGTQLPATGDYWVAYTYTGSVSHAAVADAGSVNKIKFSGGLPSGVFDNKDLNGTNYYIGGSYDDLTDTITLGTNLPVAGMPVWVTHGVGSSNSRYGGSDGVDVLLAKSTPNQGNETNDLDRNADPLQVHRLYRDVTPRDYIRTAPNVDTGAGIDQRQFVPFNQSFPDDGNSSNTFAFRVRYWSPVWGMPPQNWGGRGSSGVRLYIKFDGDNDYTVYDMWRQVPNSTAYSSSDGQAGNISGVGYYLTFEPSVGYSLNAGNCRRAPVYWNTRNNYIAMPVGRHQYFFRTCDDILLSRDLTTIQENPLVATPIDNASAGAWLEQNPPAYRKGGSLLEDDFSYADLTTYEPGPSTGYTAVDPTTGKNKLSADQHPVCHALLSGLPISVTTGALSSGYIREIPGLSITNFSGSGYFMGTLSPYIRAVHPTFKYPSTGTTAGIAVVGSNPIETAGGTTATIFTFRVIFQSFDPDTKEGRGPNYVKLFINNTADGSGSYTRSYTMSPTLPNPTADDYKKGIVYEYRINGKDLGAGSHTYYFEADAGFGAIRYPVRLDGRRTEAPDPYPDESPAPCPSWMTDPYVWGAADFADNNDYFPGPYINTAPTLRNHSVNPASGALGTEFVYRVTYSDADGQRPSMTDLIIDFGNNRVERVQMYKVDPNDFDYTNGVEYMYKVSTVQANQYALGTRRYRFEFRDDWGRPTDINDIISGELVNLPAAKAGGVVDWFNGPLVGNLARPQLLNGTVRSADGSATSNTSWTYEVVYKHNNNIAPSFVNVYIGQQRHPNDPANANTRLQVKPISGYAVKVPSLPVLSVIGVWTNSDGTGTNYYNGGSFDANTGIITLGTSLPGGDAYTGDVWVTYTSNPIVWDEGHAMVKSDPTKSNYADGVLYQFVTKLPGAPRADIPLTYYYSFQGSDGRFLARFDVVNTLEPLKSTTARTVKVLSTPVQVVLGVYTASDGSGTNYYTGGSFDPNTGVITLGTALPADQTDVYVTYVFLSPSAYAQLRQSSGEGVSDRGEYLSALSTTLYQNTRSLFAPSGLNPQSPPQPIVGPLPSSALSVPALPREPIVYQISDGNPTKLTRSGTYEVNPSSSNYSSIIRGIAQNGTTITVNSVFVKGVVSVKALVGGTLIEYYQTGSNGSYNQNYDTVNKLGLITLGQALPSGVRDIYLTYNDSGDYTLDFVNGRVYFNKPIPSTDTIEMEYMWAQAGPESVGVNTAPSLTLGSFTPDVAPSVDNPQGIDGSSQTDFVFSVVYSDQDGPTGQAPDYVRVIIDGVPHDMTSTVATNPIYKNGVKYSYTTSLDGGQHTYYFVASDGAAFAAFDKDGSKSSDTDITNFIPREGPLVNDDPTLSNGFATPNPYPSGILPGVSVKYVVTYTDLDNDPPTLGSVRVWVDNPTGTLIEGTVSAISGNTLTINGASFTPNGLTNLLLQITTGRVPNSGQGSAASGKVYQIVSNTENTVTIAANGAEAEGIVVGDYISIASLVMQKQDPNSINFNTGVVYEVLVPSLTIGSHEFHFTASAPPNQNQIRLPLTDEYDGPLVNNQPPTGNAKPVLSASANGSVSPVSGFSSTVFLLQVNYRDADNDPARFHDNVFGYVKAVFDNASIPPVFLAPQSEPSSWTSDVLHVGAVTGLPAGVLKFHFEASDGYRAGSLVARYPALSINDPSITINGKPTLSNGSVTPSIGTQSTTFTYRVTYTDLNNDAGTVTMSIDGGAPISMNKETPGTDYAGGIVYSRQVVGASLGVGSHTYQFFATDGNQAADPTALLAGPIVQSATGPTLSDGSVSPASGTADTRFTYSVWYKDPNGLPASSVSVYIDGSTTPRAMTGTNDVDPLGQGRKKYVLTNVVLTAGSHTYSFAASNGQASTVLPSSGTYTGPTVAGTGASITVSPNPASLGANIVVSGSLSPAPGQASTVTVIATRPDGTTITKSAQTTNGAFSVSIGTADISGNWQVTATWSIQGVVDQPIASSTFVVQGISIALTGGQLDLVSLMLIPSSADPAVVFGSEAVATRTHLTLWMPTLGRYLQYPTDKNSIALTGGLGFWVFPSVTETVTVFGRLWTQDQPYSISLSKLNGGWNLIGSVYTGSVRIDNSQVRYQGQTVSITEAATRGWIRDYAWGYSPGPNGAYYLVRSDAANKTLEPRRGYWIRALVDCELILRP